MTIIPDEIKNLNVEQIDFNTHEFLRNLINDKTLEKILLSDDAKQYLGVAIWHALCWIHEIRLYKKLNPFIDFHRFLLEKFISDLWDYYDKLNEYRDKPDEKVKERLAEEFDSLFAKRTGYDELDKRIALTREKKDELLLVLKFPEIREMTRLSTLIAQKASTNPT